jgi:hypothetical protein
MQKKAGKERLKEKRCEDRIRFEQASASRGQ